MAQELKMRRGTGAMLDVSVGAFAEIMVDTETKEIRAFDGTRAGGYKLGRAAQSAEDIATSNEGSRGIGSKWPLTDGGELTEVATEAESHFRTAAAAPAYLKVSTDPNNLQAKHFDIRHDGGRDETTRVAKFVEEVTGLQGHGFWSAGEVLISQSIYAIGAAQFSGVDGTILKATSDFQTSWADPVDAADGGVGTMVDKAAMFILDGRQAAVSDVTRIPGIRNIQFDGNGYAPHNAMFCGILPLQNSYGLRGINSTKARFVIAGCQNMPGLSLKSQAGTTLSSEAVVKILNTTKNSNITMFLTGTSATSNETLFIGVDDSYPGPGGELASDAVGPSNNDLYGVWEKVGGAVSPAYTCNIDDGESNRIFANLVAGPTAASVKINSGCPNNQILGVCNGGNAGGALLDNDGLGTVLKPLAAKQYNGPYLIVNNDAGTLRAEFAPNTIFGNFKTTGRWLGLSGTAQYEQVNIAGIEQNDDPLELSEADVSSGVLDHQGRDVVYLSPTVATTITSLARDVGRRVDIIPTNDLATFSSGSNQKMADRAPITTVEGEIISMRCADASLLGGSGFMWLWAGGGRRIASRTDAQIGDIANAINTITKYEGKRVMSTTDGQVYYASGPDAGDDWVSLAAPATTITPT